MSALRMLVNIALALLVVGIIIGTLIFPVPVKETIVLCALAVILTLTSMDRK